MGTDLLLDEEPVGNAENALHELCELNDRFNDRLTVRNLRLVEHYVVGNLNICAEIGWRSKNFHAVFQRADRPGDIGRNLEGGSLPRQHRANRKRIGPDADNGKIDVGDGGRIGSARRYDSTVFIESVEFMEYPKRSIPSLVWLQPMDEPLGVGLDALYFSYRVGFKSFDGATNGKTIAPPNLTTIRFNQNADKLVQRTPQIVNDVS